MQPVLSSALPLLPRQELVVRQVPATSTKLRLRLRAPTLSEPNAFVVTPARVGENPWYFDDDPDADAVADSGIRRAKPKRGANVAAADGADGASKDEIDTDAFSVDNGSRRKGGRGATAAAGTGADNEHAQAQAAVAAAAAAARNLQGTIPH